MTSFIVVARDKEKRIAFAKNFCGERAINPFDITLIDMENRAPTGARQSIGIDDIKQLQKGIFLKPLKSKQKAVILEDAHLLTPEAQNALLKVLEEPPEHTIIILGTKSKDELLPTILSRCQIITLENDTLELTTRERNSITQFIEEFPAMTVGDKLKRAELLAKDKDKAIEWIEKVIVVYREKLLSSVILVNEVHPESQNVQQDAVRDSGQARMTNDLKMLQNLYTLLKTTNVNPRLAIETTLLSL